MERTIEIAVDLLKYNKSIKETLRAFKRNGYELTKEEIKEIKSIARGNGITNRKEENKNGSK